MTDQERAVMQQALEALEYHVEQTRSIWKTSQAIDALRAALAQQQEQEQEQEQWPVAYLWQHSETGRTRVVMPDQVVTADENWLFVGSLYTHPPRREWVSLTEEDFPSIRDGDTAFRSGALWAERLLKERNT